MNRVYIAKQKVFDARGELFAYELLFRDYQHGISTFKSNMQATSHVLFNTLTNIDINELIKEKHALAFVNLDEESLSSGIIDILDKNRFVLEILETTDLSEKVISKIAQYHKRGFQIAIDDFDCSAEMIKKFTPILKYLDYIKMDVLIAEPDNLKNVMTKLKSSGIKLLAEKVESKEDYQMYREMGFDLFQGFYLSEPEVVEIDRYKDVTRVTIMQLIKLIKDDGSSSQIEHYIKQRTDLSYKLIKFVNHQESFETEIKSIIQIITLLGRDRLLRWLLLYLYAEMSDNPASTTIMNIAIKRAETMESFAQADEKDKAYIAGMFSMLGTLFDTDMKEVMRNIKMDKDITDLVLEKKGKFSASFKKVEHQEREYLKRLLLENVDKIEIIDIIYALELNGIHIDKDKL